MKCPKKNRLLDSVGKFDEPRVRCCPQIHVLAHAVPQFDKGIAEAIGLGIIALKQMVVTEGRENVVGRTLV